MRYFVDFISPWEVGVDLKEREYLKYIKFDTSTVTMTINILYTIPLTKLDPSDFVRTWDRHGISYEQTKTPRPKKCHAQK